MSYLTTIKINTSLLKNKLLSKLRQIKTTLLTLVHLAATLVTGIQNTDLIAEKAPCDCGRPSWCGASRRKVAPTISGMAEQTVPLFQSLGCDKINT